MYSSVYDICISPAAQSTNPFVAAGVAPATAPTNPFQCNGRAATVAAAAGSFERESALLCLFKGCVSELNALVKS